VNQLPLDSVLKGRFGKDLLGSMYVTLSGADKYGITSVQCMFDDEFKSRLVSLRRGQRVTIIGICDGKLGNVLLKQSKIP
jgi:hypothetical protein